MKELNLKDKVTVITGSAGVLCSMMAKRLARQGVKTAVSDVNLKRPSPASSTHHIINIGDV